mmetsp:Transcript_16656/g.20772  ORF Transcript_16656/g.20772 Transcript_16656/m.20772 type:complete len:208 (-) Transcript_16656:465-1088(-)
MLAAVTCFPSSFPSSLICALTIRLIQYMATFLTKGSGCSMVVTKDCNILSKSTPRSPLPSSKSLLVTNSCGNTHSKKLSASVRIPELGSLSMTKTPAKNKCKNSRMGLPTNLPLNSCNHVNVRRLVGLFLTCTYRAKSGTQASAAKLPLLIAATITSFNFLSRSWAPLLTSKSTSAYKLLSISKSVKKCCTARVGITLTTLNKLSVA